jgi:hypothetical protein
MLVSNPATNPNTINNLKRPDEKYGRKEDKISMKGLSIYHKPSAFPVFCMGIVDP